MSIKSNMLQKLTVAMLCLYVRFGSCIPMGICGNGTGTNRSGIIRIETHRPVNINCSWFIQPSENYITTIRIVNINVGACKDGNKLSIYWNKHSFESCKETTIPKLISLRQPSFTIHFRSIQIASKLWLEYRTRPYNECTNYDFQCDDKRKCFNYVNSCDGIFDCDDHSDEVNCGNCTKVLAPCSKTPFVCFSPGTDRCNGVIDCIHGEDEYSCVPECENAIKCPNENKCITRDKLCDGHVNCDGGMDETNCKALFCKYKHFSAEYMQRCGEYGSFDTLRSIVISVLAVVLALSIIFGALIYRWYHNRRDIQVLIADMPEFPLPPFEGPGEDTENNCERFSHEDFAIGGEIYEAYAQTRRRISSEGRQKKKKYLHLPMSAPSTKSNSPDLARNRSAASLVGAPCLSRDKTIATVVDEFYEDDLPLQVRYVNEAFSDDKSQKDEESDKKIIGLKKLFKKKRVRSAGEHDKGRNECDFGIFSVNHTK